MGFTWLAGDRAARCPPAGSNVSPGDGGGGGTRDDEDEAAFLSSLALDELH